MNKERIGIVQRAIAGKLTKSEAEWSDLYFEGLKDKNEEITVSKLKESGSNLVAHLKLLGKIQGFKDVKPNQVLAGIFAYKSKTYFPVKYTASEYMMYLERMHYGTEVTDLIIQLNPKTPMECYDHYSNPSASTVLLEGELKKLSHESKASIVAGLAVRGQESLLVKTLKKVAPETKKDALEIIKNKLDSHSATHDSAAEKAKKNLLQMGYGMIYKHIPAEKNDWVENKPIDSKTALEAANAILEAYETKLAIEGSTKRVLAELITKALADKTLNASILLLRSVNVEQRDLYSHLLDSGISPNFNISNEKTFGEYIVSKSVTRKDSKWLQLAIASGLTSDKEKTPLHESLIKTACSHPTSKANIKEIFNLILQVEEPKEIAEVTASISTAEFNDGIAKVLTDIYSTHFKNKELDGKLVGPATEMELF